MSRAGIVCLITGAMLFVSNALSVQALTLRVDRQSVTATEVSRGGSAVFFFLGYTIGSVPTRVTHATVVADPDGDGTVELSPEGGVPLIGIWAVVDRATGDVQLATRRGYRLIDLPNPVEHALAGESDAGFTRFRQHGDDVQILVVRPGTGVWTFNVTDGGPEDGDYAWNGMVDLAVGKLEPVTPDTPSIAAVSQGDVVIMVDAGQMRASATRLGQAK